MSQRKDILNRLKTNLEKIDGGRSPFGSQNYNFNINIHRNVSRNIKYLDEINDFPCLFLIVGPESRVYNTLGNTQSFLFAKVIGYLSSSQVRLDEQLLIEDVEHIINNTVYNYTDLGVQNIFVDSITTSEGLLDPYGAVELNVIIQYEIF